MSCVHIYMHTHTHMHTHKYTHTHTHANLAPCGAPGELKVSHSLPTTAQLSWSPLPEEKRNGVITGYKVQIVGPHSQQEIQVEDVSVEVSSLKPSTSYTFNVSSMTKAGTGPVATISTTTPNGETMHACMIVRGHLAT